jgi:hypothetical protein
MINPSEFWSVTISIILYSIIGPERTLRMWNFVKGEVAFVLRAIGFGRQID